MLRSLKELECIESMANGLEIEPGSQGKVVYSMLQPESLQSKSRINGHETPVALGALRPGRRLGQGGIGFERLMKGLHFPPFPVDRADGWSIAVQIARGRIQCPGAAVLVCKDLPNEPDRKFQPPQPALHRLVFWQVQRVYTGEAALKFPCIAQSRLCTFHRCGIVGRFT